MRQFTLGKTGIKVSQLCFGALPFGPLQKNLPEDECVDLLRQAFSRGVNFIDTAELYQTQSYVGKAIKGRADMVVATKSAAATYDEMQKSVERSLRELQRDQIDIYHLHAARAGVEVFEERAGAIEYLIEAKEKGLIRALGISTHRVDVVRASAEKDYIDIIFPIINKTGMGIIDGSAADMASAITDAANRGKALYAMKAFAGGNLLENRREALDYVLGIPGIDVVAIGMVSRNEIEYNVHLINGTPVPAELEEKTEPEEKQLIILRFCKGCGKCVETCPNNALEIRDNRCHVDRDKCILCGYCSSACPEFAIRLV